MAAETAVLLDAVHRHYPRGIASDDPRHAATPETLRLRAAQQEARQDRARLVALIEAIEIEIPGVEPLDYSYLTYDAGYTLRLNVGRVEPGSRCWREVVACISVIAPVYLLYQTRIEITAAGQSSTTTYAPDPDAVPLWQAVAREIERIFGHKPVTPEIGLKVVPDIQVQNQPFGEVTVYDALFTPTRE